MQGGMGWTRSWPILGTELFSTWKKSRTEFKGGDFKTVLTFCSAAMGELFSEGRFCAWKQIEIKIIHSDEKIFTSPFSSLFPLSIFSSSSWIYILKKFSKAGNVVASWWKPPKSSALNDQEPPFLPQDWGSPYLKMKCLALHDFTIFLKIICFLL